MVAAVELYFDHVTERRVRVLWDALEDAGVPTLRGLLDGKHRPHLSLAVADKLLPDEVRTALDGLDPVPTTRVTFQYTGLFVGRVLWLGSAPDIGLLRHQEAVYERLAGAGLAVSPLYAPGTWVPHCTVSMRAPRPVLTQAVRLCLETLPIEATFVAAAVADHANGIHAPL